MADSCCGNVLCGDVMCPNCPGLDFSVYEGVVGEKEPEEDAMLRAPCKHGAGADLCAKCDPDFEEENAMLRAPGEYTHTGPNLTLGEGDTLRLSGAPEGYSWVLVPAKPEGTSPGEKGHYSDRALEPIQVAEAWGMDFLEGSALKYLARYRKKGGVESLEKVKWFVDRIIQREKREGRG